LAAAMSRKNAMRGPMSFTIEKDLPSGRRGILTAVLGFTFFAGVVQRD
jgi:hypothetical protein